MLARETFGCSFLEKNWLIHSAVRLTLNVDAHSKMIIYALPYTDNRVEPQANGVCRQG